MNATDVSVQPTGDRVFCRIAQEERRVGLIHLPDGAGKSLDVVMSQVVALGPDVKTRKWDLQVGDYVLHIRVAGVKYDGTIGALGRQGGIKDADYVFLREAELLATVDPAKIGHVTGQAEYSEGKLGARSTADL